MEHFGEAIGPMVLVVVIAWIVQIVTANRRQSKSNELRAEMQRRLLDKFGTAQEMVEYLQSEAGEKFLSSAALEKGNPYQRILGSIQAGIILSLMGSAFLILQDQFSAEGAREGFVFLGVVGAATGVGFLLSAAVAYVLSKNWGLFNGSIESRRGES